MATIDAVWAANDTNAAAVIAVLDKNGKTLPVSGQDASIAGLQNVLLGKQTATVYKPFSLEAEAASDLAIKILKGEDVGTIDKELEDGTPYIAVVPVLVGPDEVQSVVDAGDASAADICTGRGRRCLRRARRRLSTDRSRGLAPSRRKAPCSHASQTAHWCPGR